MKKVLVILCSVVLAVGLAGCVGKGKVKKLAEIISAVVLAGELSLAAAISSLDWVSSHEQYGRNR